MKFEIKTEPVCAVLVAVPAHFTIVVITLGTGVQAQDSWFPITVIVTILLSQYPSSTQNNSTMKAVVKEERNAAKLTDEGGAGQNN